MRVVTVYVHTKLAPTSYFHPPILFDSCDAPGRGLCRVASCVLIKGSRAGKVATFPLMRRNHRQRHLLRNQVAYNTYSSYVLHVAKSSARHQSDTHLSSRTQNVCVFILPEDWTTAKGNQSRLFGILKWTRTQSNVSHISRSAWNLDGRLRCIAYLRMRIRCRHVKSLICK